MYIKQVIIQGFRSYRDETIVEPFSPGHNVVVGRNGSGKSNFFFAIQFVLSDEFNNLRPEQRQQLLHEGPGPRVVSAFVEIVFDNSQGRLPVDRDEVSLRRVIGSKKDQYFLDKKNITKGDVVNLLESAGLSRSNPYYIVKQGKINELAIAPDSQRLNLLREVAGTRVYDERREESKAIMRETDTKRDKVAELLQNIEERLSTLEEEKEELKEYQKWDKMRRSLEYTIHDKELRTTRDKLEEIDNTRYLTAGRSAQLEKETSKSAEEVQRVEHELAELTALTSALTTERRQLEDERQDFIRQRAKLELDVKDLEDGVSEHTRGKEKIGEELSQLEKNIKKRQQELKTILPKYQKLCDREHEMNTRLRICEQRCSELYAKQGRSQQFTSKEERDKWISKEAKSLSKTVATKEDQLRSAREEVKMLTQRSHQLTSDIDERNTYLEERRQAMDQTNKTHATLKKDRDELTNRRKELWRDEDSKKQMTQATKDELGKTERNLRSTVSKSVYNGLEAVQKIINERQIDGVYGPLIENITCDEKFFTAVEVTAGGRLFHIIVDTDRTATTILQHMNKQKLSGEVNFMPLNRMEVRHAKYPQSSDVIPMVNKLQYDPRFDAAVRTVFGKTLICRNLDVASQYSLSDNLDCITLSGDQVSRRGAMTGGYLDTRRSRMDAQRMKSQLAKQVENEQAELEAVRRELEDLDAQITSVLSELQKVEAQQIQLRETYDREKVHVRALVKEQQTLQQTLREKEGSLANEEAELQSLNNTLSSLKAELGTDLLSQLDVTDQEEVRQLNETIGQLKGEIRTCLTERTRVEGEKNTLENELSSNLLRRKDELVQELEEISVEDRQQQLEEQMADLRNVSANLDRTRARLQELEKRLEDAKKSMHGKQADLERKKAVEHDRREAMEEDAKSMDRITGQRAVLLKKKEECMHKIRELGSLPSDAFEKYQNMNTKKLFKKLMECNAQLKKYSHVNQKALDQFVTFSEQKERLVKRMDELEQSKDAILELMEVLEHRKHEQLELTFKQVSKYFSDIFKELVPNGVGRLQLVRGELLQPADSDSATPTPVLDTLKGVRILVSFSGHRAEMRDLQQLSGGQKSLVALTLIFAIQQCDPAPFYLFDEIDQALDSSHRKAVADKIRQSAQSAQFVTTTFRAELLEAADKFYGVQFRNKISSVKAVTREECLEFLEEEGTDAK